MRPARWHGLILFAILGSVAAPPALASDDPPGRGPDYKVAVWYRRDRPLETFKYQAYDLRRGEYTRAVDDWLALLKAHYPAYEVHVRDVVLAREKGDTDRLRLGSAIHRELLAAAAAEGVFLGAPIPRVQAPRPALPATPSLLGRPTLPGIGSSGRVDLSPPRPSFPVPMPYPRPHP